MARRRNPKKSLVDPRAKSEANRLAAMEDYSEEDDERGYRIAEGYELAEEQASSITRDSLKRSRKYLIIALAFLILCVGAVGAYFMFNVQNASARKTNCWLYQQKIEELATRYVTVNGFASYPAYVEDVPGFSEISWQCPDGGVYTWDPIAGSYVCSEHGHWPAGFNQAESKNKGTNTTIVNEK